MRVIPAPRDVVYKEVGEVGGHNQGLVLQSSVGDEPAKRWWRRQRQVVPKVGKGKPTEGNQTPRNNRPADEWKSNDRDGHSWRWRRGHLGWASPEMAADFGSEAVVGRNSFRVFSIWYAKGGFGRLVEKPLTDNHPA